MKRTVNRLATPVLLLSLISCGRSGSGDGETWVASLTAAKTGGTTVGETAYASSTQLLVSWGAPSGAVDHYEVTATDAIQGTTVTATATDATTTLTGLKSDTEYTITLKACRDSGCTDSLTASDSVTASTERETWQIQGTGNSYATATEVIADSNVWAYAFRYGPGAGADLEGKVRLYYNPYDKDLPQEERKKGCKPALSNSVVTDLATAMAYTGASEMSFITPSSQQPEPGQYVPGSFQAVPLGASIGGGVRLFFEFQDNTSSKRYVSLDSQDGYIGQDFNSGDSATCDQADFDGDCAPTTAIGIEPDGTAWAKIGVANQSKMGFPVLDDWRWDGSAGSAFMVIDAGFSSDCQATDAGSDAYALWNGTAWEIQYDATTGCPKKTAGQAALPVHMGGVQYKMYYRGAGETEGDPDPTEETDRPMRVIYADGALTGDRGVVEYEDWESISAAREIDYLWPDGSSVALEDESKLDDFVLFYPTGDTDFQVMYSNMAHTSLPNPIIGVAVLMNP